MFIITSSAPPQVLSVIPSSLVVNQTDTIVFTCEVFGIPTPEIMWSRGSSSGSSLNNLGNSNVLITNTRMGYNITSTLTIHSARRTDMDMYICTGVNNITNVINSTESVSVPLFVQGSQFLIIIIHV